jgi:hypothetical protein
MHRNTGGGGSNDQEENQGTNNTSHSEQSKMQADVATLQSFSSARTLCNPETKDTSPPNCPKMCAICTEKGNLFPMTCAQERRSFLLL